MLDHETTLAEATKRCVKLLSTIKEWMSEDDSEWAIGTKAHSIADVFLTVYLLRVAINKAVLAREVKSRPCLSRSFDKVLELPTPKIANCNIISLPSNGLIRVGLAIGLAVFNGFFVLNGTFGQLGVNVNQDSTLKYFGGSTMTVVGAVWALTSCGRHRLVAFCDRMLDTNKKE